jgi:hypothetical protein
MSRRKFDRFMVEVELGSNPKIGRLTDPEFRCLISGVWALAAKADPRGYLLVGDIPAEPADVAHQARCSVTVAAKTMEKLRALGMLETCEETGWEMVHDWEEINPGPKPSDRPEATRARQRKSRARHANVTRDNGGGHADVTPMSRQEVEVEVKRPPKPPTGGSVVTFDRKPVPDERLELAQAILRDFNDQAGTSYSAFTGRGRPSEDLKRVLGALADADPPLTLDEARRITRARLARPFWEGRPHTGVVFGPKVFAGNREAAMGNGSNGPAVFSAESFVRSVTGPGTAA